MIDNSMGDRPPDNLAAPEIVRDKVHLSMEDCPTCIFRGGEGKVGNGLHGYDFRNARKPLYTRLSDSIYRFLAGWRAR